MLLFPNCEIISVLSFWLKGTWQRPTAVLPDLTETQRTTAELWSFCPRRDLHRRSRYIVCCMDYGWGYN